MMITTKRIFAYILRLICMGRISYFVQYNKKSQTTSTYSRITDDILFQVIPEHFQLPVFLYADETGGYYSVSNVNLDELKCFIEENNISEKLGE